MKVKALVVDDSATDRIGLAQLLRKMGFGEVKELDRAQFALAGAIMAKPNVIFMDVVMPEGASGFEATRQLKRNDETKDIPVIVVSSKSRVPDITAAINNGAKAYIVKPPNRDKVLAALHEAGVELDEKG